MTDRNAFTAAAAAAVWALAHGLSFLPLPLLLLPLSTKLAPSSLFLLFALFSHAHIELKMRSLLADTRLAQRRVLGARSSWRG